MAPPLLNAKGQPVKVNFLDIFMPAPYRSGKGGPRQDKKTPKNEETTSTETSPQSAAGTEDPADSSKNAGSGPSEWSKLERMALLGMKNRGMSWKEIDDSLPGRELEDIMDKYVELYVNRPTDIKPKKEEGKKEVAKKEEKDDKKEAKAEEAKPADESKQNADVKKVWIEGKQWKKDQKVQKGKGKIEEAKLEEVKPKGFLKAKANAGGIGSGGELTSIDGHPVIFIDDDEELEFHELLFLYRTHAKHDVIKWMDISSRFFDEFGKRVEVEKLKEKLASTW